jgi:excisionase family DNA binding protein
MLQPSELLTLPEASALLRLKVSTLRAWVLRRRIPYVKVGRLVRVRRADVERLIAASVVPARPVDRPAFAKYSGNEAPV